MPSGWALLPVFGTVVIIIAQHTQAKIMSNPLATWLGDRSYSLYLWHWPLVVASYFADLHNDPLWVLSAFALSLLLGHLSYRWIETPTRIYLGSVGLFKQVLMLGGVGILVGSAAVGVRLFTFEGRLPTDVEVAAAEENNQDPRRKECFEAATGKGSPGCIYGADKVGVILMGDSHAASTITALGDAALNNGQGALFFGMSSCPTFDDIKYAANAKRPTHICNEMNQWANKELYKHKNTPLVLVSRTSSYVMGPNEPDRQEEVKLTWIYFSKPYIYRAN